MSYYLLRFTKDTPSNRKVSAIACMTQDQYESWLSTPMVHPDPVNLQHLLQLQKEHDTLYPSLSMYYTRPSIGSTRIYSCSNYVDYFTFPGLETQLIDL